MRIDFAAIRKVFGRLIAVGIAGRRDLAIPLELEKSYEESCSVLGIA